SFNGTGIVLTNLGYQWKVAGHAVAVDSSNRIVIATCATGALPGASCSLVLARFLPNGALDDNFVINGIVIVSLFLAQEPNAILITPDQELLVAVALSCQTPPCKQALTVHKFENTGTLAHFEFLEFPLTGPGSIH